ncbi:hypothetical protein BDF14DRAFT_1982473 [Spinellus fusiger]|nr:hypothetical protein BDF14DRAFT_1982473 [Spinellus fusiger]
MQSLRLLPMTGAHSLQPIRPFDVNTYNLHKGSANKDSVFDLYYKCKTRKDWEPLEHYVQSIFTDLDALSMSFLNNSKENSMICPVDKHELNQTLTLLQTECPSSIFEAVFKCVNELLLDCAKDKDRTYTLLQLNSLVIIFQCVLFEREISTTMTINLCGVIASLCHTLQDVLCIYLIEDSTLSRSSSEKLSKDTFSFLLDLFHNVVRNCMSQPSESDASTRRLPETSLTPNSNPAVIDATRCLAMLYRFNEQHHFVSYADFYNDTVNENLEIKEDFPNFKDHKGFSFCDYSFILNPAVKADILKVESVFQMRHELQDAFFRTLLQGVNSPYLVLEIRRDHIISDALQQLYTKSIHDLKKQLRVQFVGEEGVDEGGVQKEFFQLIVRELFDLKYDMFSFNDESRLYWFSTNPNLDDHALQEYRLAGLLLGLAVYNSVILDIHFPRALYKKLMNVDVDLEDLKQLDPSLGKGLERLLSFDGVVESEYERYFQVDIRSCGNVHTYDLKPSGSSILLTRDNREEFVKLYIKFVLETSIEKSFSAFVQGFRLVCQDSAIKIFRPEEIEQLICGCSDLDFEALEKSTVYDGGWTNESPIIKYFWEIVHAFSYHEKKKLLFFATGSDRAPIGGLSKLQFVIAKNGGDSDRLPTSHTCYNVLLLCEYSSKEKLRERLLTSISNSEGFGMI